MDPTPWEVLRAAAKKDPLAVFALVLAAIGAAAALIYSFFGNDPYAAVIGTLLSLGGVTLVVLLHRLRRRRSRLLDGLANLLAIVIAISAATVITALTISFVAGWPLELRPRTWRPAVGSATPKSPTGASGEKGQPIIQAQVDATNSAKDQSLSVRKETVILDLDKMGEIEGVKFSTYPYQTDTVTLTIAFGGSIGVTGRKVSGGRAAPAGDWTSRLGSGAIYSAFFHQGERYTVETSQKTLTFRLIRIPVINDGGDLLRYVVAKGSSAEFEVEVAAK